MKKPDEAYNLARRITASKNLAAIMAGAWRALPIVAIILTIWLLVMMWQDWR